MNQKSNSTQRVSRAWFGVLSVIGLMVAATILGGGAQATANKFVYHVGDAFLASVNPDFAPDFALSTATGDRLQLSGTGTFNAGARRVDGGGTFVHTHADGTLVFAQGSEDRQRHLSMHMTQVYRIASATLARAGLGAMRRGVIEGSSEMTFLRSDGGVILGVALPREIEVGGGLVQVGRLWTDLNIKA